MRSVPSYIFFSYKTCFSNFCSVCDKSFILLWYGVRRCCPVVISHCLTDAYHSSFSSVFCCRLLSQSQFPSLCKCVYFEMFHVKHMPNDRKINGRKKENIEKDKKKLWWWKGRQLPKQGIVTEKTNGIHGRGMSLDREKKNEDKTNIQNTQQTQKHKPNCCLIHLLFTKCIIFLVSSAHWAHFFHCTSLACSSNSCAFLNSGMCLSFSVYTKLWSTQIQSSMLCALNCRCYTLLWYHNVPHHVMQCHAIPSM